MLRLAFDFIITWRETRTRPNAYYYWCSWYGKEVKTPINRCDKITLKTEQI